MQSGRQQGTRKRKMRRQPQPKKPLALDDLPPPAPIDEQRFARKAGEIIASAAQRLPKVKQRRGRCR
jgi:hypothetical protein